MNKVRIAVAQIDTVVGDLAGNTEKILFYINEATKKKVDIVVFPELAVTGYPPEDLLLKPHFIKENLKYLRRIIRATGNIITILGFVGEPYQHIYNRAGVLLNKKIVYAYSKINLPNYGVFDEKRYFESGKENVVLGTEDFCFTVNICEDIWSSESIAERHILQQVDFLVNISASPYHLNKLRERRKVLIEKARRFKIPIVYCNLIGGQDELIFDGRSVIFNRNGRLIAEAKAFEEDLLIVDLPIDSKRRFGTDVRTKFVMVNYRKKEKKSPLPIPKVKKMKKVEEVYSALVLGVRDYVKKNNFSKVTFGLSGGIDSAVVACIAVDALGKANVLALSMPSIYSSKHTQDDAEKISRNLGIRFVRISIDTIFNVYLNTLSTHFAGMDLDKTEENIQARIRGNILMAFSNKFGYLVLNTGNKSETSVGYCTLYGDMAGGFAVIKDVPKNLVYKLGRFVNNREKREVIPNSVFRREPSAELRYGQKDQDTLPSYRLLDKIIGLYIDKNKSFSQIVKEVKDEIVVKKVLQMVDMNEYKRRQSPPGIKITPKAFGKDRRMPITNKFNEYIIYGTK